MHGENSGICLGGGLNFFSFQGEAQLPLGHENPLKSIYFTGPGGGLSPNSPPPEYASGKRIFQQSDVYLICLHKANSIANNLENQFINEMGLAVSFGMF